ncbi:hypothetical protein [Salinactinospora qingdaonensis]|uniref:DUF222 domain-containing protein n=1 Tax=Salinactinospora qingdaonensis TaxID=702744 RepID=A0ABP7GIW5_9ACTN
MIDAFRAAFQELIDASVAGDVHRMGPAVREANELASRVPVEEREIALDALAPIFAGHYLAPGLAADLMVVAGALVEKGTRAGETGVEVLRQLRETGRSAGVFYHAWERTGGGTPPDPDEVSAADEQRVAQVLGEEAPAATRGWWTARRYGLAARTMLWDADVRAALREDDDMRADLLAVAGRLGEVLSEYAEITTLLRMAEVASALVLDRDSRRGFHVSFDGIADNAQLHLLLANALVGSTGQNLAGQRPRPEWVAAFTDGDNDAYTPLQGWWTLRAADGSRISHEGCPADIPATAGQRVVVLEQPPDRRTWRSGRRYAHLAGRLWVDDELSGDHLAAWWRHIDGPEAEPVAAATPVEAAAAAPTAAAPVAVPASPTPQRSEEPGTPPGAGLLPRLPPGVADSAGWRSR